jgi:small subunit ribosomal protein S8
MSMQDPIADMMSRIRNAQATEKETVSMPSSKHKAAIACVLKEEGYILDYKVMTENKKPTLIIALKYFQGKPVIEHIKRVSRPGLRIYKPCDRLPTILGGLGVVLVSTSKGILSDRAARAQKVGGEIIGEVS